MLQEKPTRLSEMLSDEMDSLEKHQLLVSENQYIAEVHRRQAKHYVTLLKDGLGAYIAQVSSRRTAVYFLFLPVNLTLELCTGTRQGEPHYGHTVHL